MQIVSSAMNLMPKHFVFRHTKSLIAGCLLFILCILVYNRFVTKAPDWQFAATEIGGIFALIFFIQKQRLDDVKLFHELFTSFNRRFAEINDELNEIAEGDPAAELTKPQRDTLNTYFDLCAEESFFASEEYIYPNVWTTWQEGMAYFYRNARIRKYWDKRVTREAYYGFDARPIREIAERKGPLLKLNEG